MNKIRLILLLTILSGCAPVTVQLCTIMPVPTSNRNILTTSYNFWEEGGQGYFQMYNSSDSFLSVNLKESFFIINGIVSDYYANVTTSSGNAVVTKYSEQYQIPFAVNRFNLVTYTPDPILILPPNTGRIIRLPAVSKSYIKDCNKDEKGKRSFEESSSPFIIRNILTYYIEDSNVPKRLSDSFYLSELEDIPTEQFWNTYNPTECGKPTNQILVYSPYYNPQKFYLIETY